MTYDYFKIYTWTWMVNGFSTLLFVYRAFVKNTENGTHVIIMTILN